jgi:hypothetical protein
MDRRPSMELAARGGAVVRCDVPEEVTVRAPGTLILGALRLDTVA